MMLVILACLLSSTSSLLLVAAMKLSTERNLRRKLMADNVELMAACSTAAHQASLWERAYRFGRSIKTEPGMTTMSQSDIKRLLLLCHPDKHGGKQAAVEMTQRLLQMRGN